MSNQRLPADEYATSAGAATAPPFNGSGSNASGSSLRDRAEQFLGGTRVQERVHEMADAASERVSATADYLRNTGATRMRSDVEGLVKNNPGPAILIAATLGFLIGRALTRD